MMMRLNHMRIMHDVISSTIHTPHRPCLSSINQITVSKCRDKDTNNIRIASTNVVQQCLNSNTSVSGHILYIQT